MSWPGTIPELSGHPRGETDMVMKVWRPAPGQLGYTHKVTTFSTRQEADAEIEH